MIFGIFLINFNYLQIKTLCIHVRFMLLAGVQHDWQNLCLFPMKSSGLPDSQTKELTANTAFI